MLAAPSKTPSGSLTGQLTCRQSAEYFCIRPTVVTVVDSQGKMVPDRVRVSWGRLENFKCVDYFQIEYYEKDDRVCMISPLYLQIISLCTFSDGYC